VSETGLNKPVGGIGSFVPEVGLPAFRKSQSLGSKWGREFAVVILLAGVLPLLEAARYHTLGQPLNDDWSYLNALAHLAQHGTINFNHWASVFDVGQLVLTSPLYLVFGVHPALAMLWVWFVGMAGIFGVAYLARRCGVARNVSLVLIAALSVCPLFMRLDVSFMTDVPMFSVMVLSLCLWIDCKERSTYEWRRFVALGLATVAFTIREPGALVAVPVLLEPFVNTRRRDLASKRRMLAIGAGWAVAICGLWLWRQHFQSGGSPPMHLSLAPLFTDWFSGWLPSMLGLFMLPVLLALRPWTLVPKLIRSGPRSAWFVGTIVMFLPILGVLARATNADLLVQVGNSVDVDTAIPLTLRLPLVFLGLVSFAACITIVLGSRRPRAMYVPLDRRADWGLLCVIVPYTGFLVGCRVLGLANWDRYWLIDVALGSIILIRAGKAQADLSEVVEFARARSRWAVWGAVALVALVGMTIFSDSAAFLSGEWAFAQTSAAHLPSGYDAKDISAGWIWDGYIYTEDPISYKYPATTVAGFYRIQAGDGSGSFYFIGRGTTPGNVETCAPWTVEAVLSGATAPNDSVVIGPVGRGLFESVRFVLVRQPLAECVRDGDHYNLDFK
jgi:hypothetical protein